MAESEDGLKGFLRRVKEESERASLRLNIEKTKIYGIWLHYFLANRRGKCGSSDRFPLLGLPNQCRQCLAAMIRRQLLLGRRAMTNLDRMLQSRDIAPPTKVRIVKAMVFTVVMYSCESWTIKKENAKESMPLNCSAGEDF